MNAAAKHYRIAQAFIRQVCGDKIAVAVPVDSAYNPADLGTKPLLAPAFERHRLAIMGPQDRPT